MNDNKKLVRIGIAFLACVIVAFVAWLVATGQAESLVGALAHADIRWFAVGMACFCAFFGQNVLKHSMKLNAGNAAGESILPAVA